MKVAIITMHAARNYGAVLQTYALQNYIETHGNECVIMDYQLPNQSTRGYLLNINGKFRKNAVTKLAYLMKTFLPKCLTTKLFHAFLNRQLHLSRPVRVCNGKPEDVPEADVYCAGSDQIWNPRANGGFHPMYFLEGINGKKISYASSIGIDRFTEDEKTAVQGYLQGFEHISVRELSGVPMLEELGYHEGYLYSHDYPNHFVKQQYMPNELQGRRFWVAQGSPQEQKMTEWMRKLWGETGASHANENSPSSNE